MLGQFIALDPAGLLQGPIDQRLQFAQVVGEVVLLQPFHHPGGHAGRLLPAKPTALLADAVAQPFPQVLAAHPQRRHTDQAAAAVKAGQDRFAGKEQPAGVAVRQA